MKYKGLLLAFLIPYIISAQKNYRPGRIVTLKSDTISGFINYKEWGQSPTSILFKTSGSHVSEKEYTVNDLSFFDITGYEAYRRYPVKISLHPAKIADIGARDTSSKIDTVFLKVIYSDQLLNLFSYSDKLKERFYVLENGQQQPTELIFREYLKDGSLSLVNESTYKIQLENLSRAAGSYSLELAQKIKEATFEERDIKKIVTLINKAGNEERLAEKEIRRTHWFVGAGLQRSEMTFTGNHPMARNPHTSQSQWSPRISAGVDLFVNPNIGKTFIRLEAGYETNKSTITTNLPENEKAVYSLSGSTVSLRAQLNYTLYNSDKIKIPVGAGVFYNQMNSSKNQYKKVYARGNEDNHVENWLNLKSGAMSFFMRGSVVVNDKIETSFMYSPSLSLTKTIAYSVGRSNTQVQVYYLFRKKK